MIIRQLGSYEISQFHQLNRSEIVEHIYYFRNGKLELEDERYDIADWTAGKKEEFISHIRELNNRGGVVLGAFDADLLVGVSTLGTRFLGTNDELLNLDGLWVSSTHRNQGVATQLVNSIQNYAIDRGAKGLYVSATPSKNTVEFYMNRGFVPTDDPDPILYEKEPEDIHMIKLFS